MGYGDLTYKKYKQSFALTEDFQDLLLYQYQVKAENLKKMIKIHWDRIGQLILLLQSLVSLRSINIATGKTLDMIGEIVGQERQGKNDSDYCKWIKFGLLLNQFSGTAEEIISAVLILTSGTKVELLEDGYAGVFLYTNGYDIDTDIIDSLEQIAAGGVKIQGLIHSELTGGDFCVEIESPDTTTDGELGFAELNEENDENGLPIGGQFTELYI